MLLQFCPQGPEGLLEACAQLLSCSPGARALRSPRPRGPHRRRRWRRARAPAPGHSSALCLPAGLPADRHLPSLPPPTPEPPAPPLKGLVGAVRGSSEKECRRCRRRKKLLEKQRKNHVILSRPYARRAGSVRALRNYGLYGSHFGGPLPRPLQPLCWPESGPLGASWATPGRRPAPNGIAPPGPGGPEGSRSRDIPKPRGAACGA